MALTVKAVRELTETLKELPAVDDGDRELSKMEAVAMMATAIHQLRQKGYSWDRIAEKLTAAGIQINPATLKSYMARAASSKKGGAKRRRRQPGSNQGKPATDPNPTP